MRGYGAILLILALSLVAGGAHGGRRLAEAARPYASAVAPAAGESPTAQAAPDPLSAYLELAARGGTDEEGIAELRLARTLARDGDAAASLEAFGRAAERVPGLADWIRVLAADAVARAGDTAAVQRLLAATDPALARDRGWRAVVHSRAAAGDTAGALAVAEAAALRLQAARGRAEAWKLAADLRLAGRDTAGARLALRRAVDASPVSPSAIEAARALGALPDAAAEDRLRIGRAYLDGGHLDRGVAGLDAYLACASGTPAERAAVRLEIGRALFRARRYGEAERRLLALASGSAPDSVAAEALLLAGRARYRTGRVTAARTAYARAAERFPGERAAAEALFLLADLEHDAGRLESAREFYRRAIAGGGDPERAGEAAMRLGGLAYAHGDHAAAAEIFEVYRTAHGAGPRYQQASYWAARAHLALGAEALAYERLREAWQDEPTSYYGLRAAQHLRGLEWSAVLAPSPGTDARAETEVAGAFVRLRVLEALELTESAAYEMERVKRYFAGREGGLYALAEGFLARGRIAEGILLGREIRSREGRWNERLLRIVYPFPYRDEIVAVSGELGLDPFLVAGLIRQESMFKSTAVSRAGAVGLMQIMPATGRALARRIGVAGFQRGLLERPETNVRLGSLFLAELLQRYDGRVADALIAYNAGPTRLRRWRALPEYGDEDLFAERIPFAETRDYVKRVRQNAELYAALYGGGSGMRGVDEE